MLYSFSDSSWTRSGQDSILVTAHRAQWPAAGFGIVTYHTHSLFPLQPQVFDGRAVGLGKSGRGSSTDVFKDLQLEPSMKPVTATFSVPGRPGVECQ